MKIVLAPDSFKGSMSACDVARFMEMGVRKIIPSAIVECLPIADGGEGTLDAFMTSVNGKIFTESVKGPNGKIVEAKWGIFGDHSTAVIEMAEASGLSLVPKDELNPLISTTYGTGQLINKAVEYGCKKIIIGLGGSGTNDGGAGMAAALGVKFYDNEGIEFEPCSGNLINIASVSVTGMNKRLEDVEVIAVCDVTNPLCGSNGASAIFGPQKGATPEIVGILDESLKHYATILMSQLSKDIKDIPGAGAAGGLGAGLLAFLNTRIESGIDFVLDIIEFEEKLIGANLVITGEGRTDEQTCFGKAPMGVGVRAKKYNIPVFCISGSLDDGYQELKNYGIQAFFSIVDCPQSLDEAQANTERLLISCVENVISACKALSEQTVMNPQQSL